MSDFGEQFKNAVGRPAKFKDAEEMKSLIQDYFDTRGWIKIDGVDEKQFKSPTISGMALHLGFCNRASMYDYKEKPEFTNIIKKATSLIESYHEESLAGKNPTGHIFVLKNLGWADQSKIEIKTNADSEAERKSVLDAIKSKHRKK